MKLPIGIQSFRKIREDGYVYADKTREIYRLLQDGVYYFLSRPRRFGKSLLIDTMWELFLGHKELFEGLWIAGDESDYDFTAYPVLRFDMTQVKISDPESLEEDLLSLLDAAAEEYELGEISGSIATRFTTLISKLAIKYGKRVVVLIDEYDKPIIDHINAPEMAQANRELLGNFYGILKGQDVNLQFVFLTGVSKFTKLSLFAKLNNLMDLTLWNRYANICGITECEFDELFSGIFDDEKCEKIFSWYDGFSWDGKTKVFNPFSLLSYLRDREFNTYWYSTGTPTFLAGIFKDRPFEYADIQGVKITERELDSHDIENAPLVSLLFQTGFLTVIKADRSAEPPEFTLGFPNVEVSGSISELFLTSDPDFDPYGNAFFKDIKLALDEGRAEDIAAPIEALFASIPYQLHIRNEAYYHTMFLVIMQFLNFRVSAEISVARGRIDGVLIRPNGHTYIIEFKYAKDEDSLDTALDEAMEQIEKRGYADPYTSSPDKLHKVGIAVADRGKVSIRAK